MTFDQSILEFLESLRDKNYSPKTIILREGCLNYFKRFLSQKGIKTINNISLDLIEKFINHFSSYKKKNGKDLSITRVYVYLVSLRLFLSFCFSRNYLLVDYAKDIVLPKLPNKLPKDVLSISEAKKILAIVNTSTKYGLRDKAILEVLYSTGIRNNELCQLKVCDVDFENQLVLVAHGKGNKARLIPISQRALKHINNYLVKSRKEFVFCNTDFLFLNKFGKALQNFSLSPLVRSYIRAANINKLGSCHLFRHSMATHMLMGGASIRYIQEILGHVEISTTEIYTRVDIVNLTKVYNKAVATIWL